MKRATQRQGRLVAWVLGATALALSACTQTPTRDADARAPARVQQAVPHGAQTPDIDERVTRLVKAARDGDAAIVAELLEQKIDPDARNADGHTALLAAATNACGECVELLLAAGADPDLSEPDSGWTPLMTAAFFGWADIARQLLDAGAEVNATNRYGETALLQATFRGQDAVVEVLLARGADVTPRNDKGFSALGAARHKQYSGIVQALEASGARE